MPQRAATGATGNTGATYEDWVGRTETARDVASQSAAVGLSALLDHPAKHELVLHGGVKGPVEGCTVEVGTVEHGAAGENAATCSAELFPLGHWLHFTPTTPMSELGADGHPKLGNFMPPLDLPRRMWAGSRIEFHTPIRIGQSLERLSTIESITPKSGASGRLCFVVVRHEIFADGALALIDRHTIVYREAVEIMANPHIQQLPPRTDGAAPTGWEWVITQRPIETTLFRYSALTFNTHRIHYDLSYVTGVEGYPGLVTHGPLLATYLVDGFLQHQPDAKIESFEFTARSTIYCNEQVHAVGRLTDAGVAELAIIAPDGSTAITAKLCFQ